MDLVWSRMEGYPWWPGVLLTDEERLASGVELPEDGTYNALVKNFGTNDVTPVNKGDPATIQPFFTSSTISKETVDSRKLDDAKLYTYDTTLALAVQEAFTYSGLEAVGSEWMSILNNSKHVDEGINKEEDHDDNLLELGMELSGDYITDRATDANDNDDRKSMEEDPSTVKIKKEKHKHKKSKEEKRKAKKEKRKHRNRDRDDNDNDDNYIYRRRRMLREATRSIALKSDAIIDRRKKANRRLNRLRGKSSSPAHRDGYNSNESFRNDMLQEHDTAYIDAVTYIKRHVTNVELEKIRDDLVKSMEAGNVSETWALLRMLCDIEVSYKQLALTGIGVVVGELLNTSLEFVALSQFYSIANALLECWFHKLDEKHKKRLILQVMKEKQEREEGLREAEMEAEMAVYRHIEDDDLGAYIEEMANVDVEEAHSADVVQESQMDMPPQEGEELVV